MKKGYLNPTIVIILALITLGVAATLIFNAKLFPKPKALPTPITQPSPLLTPSPAAETANWKIRKSFIDSRGEEKFIFSDDSGVIIKTEPIERSTNRVVLSTDKNDTLNAIVLKDFRDVDLGESPFISTNKGVKYIVLTKSGPGDSNGVYLFDEDGKEIGIDLTEFNGLFDSLRKKLGLYSCGTYFGEWLPNSTKFTLLLICGGEQDYSAKATFDASTGQQIGDTEQVK